MSSSWRGWVRLQAFCPDDASRGSEIGYWAGTVTDWNPRVGNTLRSAGFIVDIDGRDLSDAGYVCREGSVSSFSKPRRLLARRMQHLRLPALEGKHISGK
jgi:hypothetical protein